ncbi:MAG: ParB/RepB/Spo0J family partition protein [Pyrobaculum sp.]
MQFLRINIDSLVVKDILLPVKHDPKLCQSIELTNIVMPIIVKKVGDKFEVIDGVHRIECLKKMGVKEVDAIVVDSDVDTQIYRFLMNQIRGKICAHTRAIVVSQLEPSLIKTLKIKSSTVRKYKKVAEMLLSLPGLNIKTLDEMCPPFGLLYRCLNESRDFSDLVECLRYGKRLSLRGTKLGYETIVMATEIMADSDYRRMIELWRSVDVNEVLEIICSAYDILPLRLKLKLRKWCVDMEKEVVAV